MAHWRKIERDVCDALGEGTLWSERDDALYWVDIHAPALNRLNLADDTVERWAMPEPLGWVVERASGGLIGGFQSGLKRIALDPVEIEHLHDPEPHLPGNRMNDGKVGPDGAIWCGTLQLAEEEALGTLYRFTPDGRCAPVDSGYVVPNGPTFSPDGAWLYHTDSPLRTVYRFALGPDGLGARETFITFHKGDGYPDGMTTDAEGYLWIAHWDGARISRFAPDGTLERSIALPAERITNITFAGPDLDRMFVTSAATGLPASQYDGALFEVECGAKGMPTPTFAA